MEAIKPGSSEYLQKFSKQGSLHRSTPHSPQGLYNPYSLAEPEPDYGMNNGTAFNSQPSNKEPFPSMSSQPLNYMEPVPSGCGWENEDQVYRSSQVGVQSALVHGNVPVGVSQTSLSVDSNSRTTLQNRGARGAGDLGHVNPRQAHHRSTFTHLEREHPTVPLLSRAYTERTATRNPEHHEHPTSRPHSERAATRNPEHCDHPTSRPHIERVATRNPEHSEHLTCPPHTERTATKSPEHLYELDGMRILPQLKPPPLPQARPRNKQPPPRLKSDSASLSHSLSTLSSKSDGYHADEVEPRYINNQRDSASKEAEYDISTQPPEPSPRGRTRPVSGGTSQARSSDGSVSSLKGKPPITPRKIASHAKLLEKPLEKPAKVPDYLDLLGSSTDVGGMEDMGDMLNGSTSSESTPLSGPSLNLPGFSEEVVKNFNPNQLDVLISMLKQVQSGGKQQQAPTLQPSENSSATMDHKQLQNKFG